MDTVLYRELAKIVDGDNLIKRLKEMISIKSENPFDSEPREGFREKEMGEYYAEMMSELDLQVECREVLAMRPNVFGYRKGQIGKMKLMLAGHMDTAPTDGYADAYEVRLEAGKVYGRGTCDMKAALAAYLEVVRILKVADIKLKGDLILAGIIDEEYQMLGSKDVGKNGPSADQGIIGEPSDLNICPCHKGQLGTIIRTLGKSAHSSIPEKGRNAIIDMASVIQAFSDYNSELLQKEPHPLCGHGRFNLGVIKGGTIVSTVPDYCELEVDRRTLPGEKIRAVYDEYRSRLNRLSKKIPGFRYEISAPTWDIPPNEISHNEPVVQSLLSAYKEVMGRSTEVFAFPASTDAPNMGFSTVICGPGSIEQAHRSNEFVSVDQLIRATQIYLWSVLELLS